MFNPEKLLGGMLRSGRRGRGLGSLVSGGAVLGLVGVAMEAVEHYMNKPASTGHSVPPPAPGNNPGPEAGAPPPLPSGQAGIPPVPPPLSNTHGGSGRHGNAVLLIRAMIAAANADGVIDADERANIMGKLQSVDLTKEEHAFIVHELLDPKPLPGLLSQVNTRELAEQVYAVSLLAIEADTAAEHQYLRELAKSLGLGDTAVADIHQRLDVAVPQK